jgi:hypothetical protein
MTDQLPLFQQRNLAKKSLPVYRVTLVREGQSPSYEQRIRSLADAGRMLAT